MATVGGPELWNIVTSRPKKGKHSIDCCFDLKGYVSLISLTSRRNQGMLIEALWFGILKAELSFPSG